MGTALRYWRLVTIRADGKRRQQEIPNLKTFWQQQFPNSVDSERVPDLIIQRQLVQIWQANPTSQADPLQENTSFLAECCLRCFISNQIESTCWQLEEQFGALHGIQAIALFPLVLTDLVPLSLIRQLAEPTSPYRSLATEILQAFDPTQSNLSTWTNRLVRSHPDLKAFLLEHGLYLVSDWALLNDTSPAQVQRILLEFCGLSELEIKQAVQLLQSYHTVYQRDRLQQRRAGARGACAEPTPNQLMQIAQRMPLTGDRAFSPEQIKQNLQTLVQHLREYRVAVRSKKLPTRSIDDANNPISIGEIPIPSSESDSSAEFLVTYRQTLLGCLDLAIAEVVDSRLTHHQRKNPPTDQRFLTALHLFHCRGKAMSDIAAAIGLHKQYEVSRLLKLRELRADVRQNWLLKLRDQVRDLAQTYVDSARLQQVDQQLETVLEEQVSSLIEEAEAEASVGNRSLKSQFARRLCSNLDKRGI
ncbi:hypothetical protein H6F93_18705 [Leptolyngbya sp. FACHB-671]|uniref:hypothetical protein n=1 Tax=Leptolyngbya sp. FACHB-671 TaxID=2692812 RepID=UPI0016839CDD|nr:hypothetical protein [Leptolyngbya sp. FACHB-671]MBD2069529.1 hypothetical protein [Leptolyngbya sp. FACHB-671]